MLVPVRTGWIQCSASVHRTASFPSSSYSNSGSQVPRAPGPGVGVIQHQLYRDSDSWAGFKLITGGVIHRTCDLSRSNIRLPGLWKTTIIIFKSFKTSKIFEQPLAAGSFLLEATETDIAWNAIHSSGSTLQRPPRLATRCSLSYGNRKYWFASCVSWLSARLFQQLLECIRDSPNGIRHVQPLHPEKLKLFTVINIVVVFKSEYRINSTAAYLLLIILV
jgi:hypothetical protein